MSSSPSPSFFDFDAAGTANAFQDAFQDAFRRYLQGLKAVVKSYDVPVGLTPKQTVWALNKTKLYRYVPTQPPEKRCRIPLLLVYALINKPYIFDLRPGRSFVEFMLHQGFDVFLLDWGAPGPEDKHIRFDDYATMYLPRAVRKMLRVSRAREFNLLGYCIGSTLATLYAVAYPDAPIRNLALLAAPLDFSQRQDSVFATWLDERFFDVDHFVDVLGNIPVELIVVASKMLKPVENYVGAYASLWERLDDDVAVENWQAMHRWVHDGVPFAGEAFRQWVKAYVRGNQLMSLDLSRIRAPLLNVIAQYDHIVPNSQSLSIMERVSSTDKRLEVIPAGHVGIMAGRGASHDLWPKIAAWLRERSDG